MLKLPLILFPLLYHSVSSAVQFRALPPHSTFQIPGADPLVRNIDQLSPHYTHADSHTYRGEVTVDSESTDRQQFHTLVRDRSGPYYSTKSIVYRPCSLEEVEQSSYFYENIPHEFLSGLAALIPCLITGIPTPHKTIQRCSDATCEQFESVNFADHVITVDGHVVVRNSSEQDSGWYRCVAENICGSLTSAPVYLTIRQPKEMEGADPFIISRRTEDFDLSETIDELMEGPIKTIRRNLSEYELWQLNTTNPSYHDEVLFQLPNPIYFYAHPTFWPNNGIDDKHSENEINYGWSSHNNSFDSHYNYIYGSGVGQWRVVTFKTDFQASPVIVSRDQVPPVVRDEQFKITFLVEGWVGSEFQCFRGGVRLENNWKTRLDITTIKNQLIATQHIIITVRYPLKSDSGYYQCSVSGDVVYLSEPVYVDVKDPIPTFVTHVQTTATSANISWQLTTLPDTSEPPQNLVLLISEHSPIPTTTSSISLNNLHPYRNYTWRVISPHQTPVTDPRVFRTGPAIPTSSVGPLSVSRATTSLTLSWRALPRNQWLDSFVYFSVHVTQVYNSTRRKWATDNQTTVVKEWAVKSYKERIVLTKLDQATQYNVSVAACNSRGCSDNTSDAALVTKHVTLRARPHVQAVFVGLSHVSVLTTEVETGVETYLELFHGIQCYSAPEQPSDNLIQLTVPVSKVENLRAYTTYSLRVQTTNGYSTSPWSACLVFRTKFNWFHVIVPAVCVVFVLVLLAVARALVKSRCPDVVNKIKQALEPKYLNILPNPEEWDQGNEVSIIHTKIENCDL